MSKLKWALPKVTDCTEITLKRVISNSVLSNDTALSFFSLSGRQALKFQIIRPYFQDLNLGTSTRFRTGPLKPDFQIPYFCHLACADTPKYDAYQNHKWSIYQNWLYALVSHTCTKFLFIGRQKYHVNNSKIQCRSFIAILAKYMFYCHIHFDYWFKVQDFTPNPERHL